jgi:hypothetical protein
MPGSGDCGAAGPAREDPPAGDELRGCAWCVSIVLARSLPAPERRACKGNTSVAGNGVSVWIAPKRALEVRLSGDVRGERLHFTHDCLRSRPLTPHAQATHKSLKVQWTTIAGSSTTSARRSAATHMGAQTTVKHTASPSLRPWASAWPRQHRHSPSFQPLSKQAICSRDMCRLGPHVRRLRRGGPFMTPTPTSDGCMYARLCVCVCVCVCVHKYVCIYVYV